jgi:hypothetical protein
MIRGNKLALLCRYQLFTCWAISMCLPLIFFPNLSLQVSIIRSHADQRAPPAPKWPDPNPTRFQCCYLLVFCSGGNGEEDAGVEAYWLRRWPLPSSSVVPLPASSTASARAAQLALQPPPPRSVLLGDEIPVLAPLLLRDNALSLPCSAWLLRPYQRRGGMS